MPALQMIHYLAFRLKRVNAGINSIGNASVISISPRNAYDGGNLERVSALGSALGPDFWRFEPNSILMDCFRWLIVATRT